MSKQKGVAGHTIETIEFDSADVRYPTQTKGLGPFSIKLQPGTFYWVRGESGSGKSTLLKAIAGIVTPVAGKYLLNGRDVCDMTFEEFLPYRLNIGYSFASGGLLNNRTLKENLALPLLYHGRCEYVEGNEFALAIMSQMGISDFADTRPALAPDGVLKIANIIRAFIMGPQVIILDDPTGGLDATRIDRVNRWLSYYRLKHRDSIFLVATDHEELIRGYSASEICINEGEVWVVENSDLSGVG